MKLIRDGLLGNFFPLANAVRTIGSRTSVPIREVDLHLGLNGPKDKVVVEWRRDADAYHPRFAHGVVRLLHLLLASSCASTRLQRLAAGAQRDSGVGGQGCLTRSYVAGMASR